MKLRDVFEVTTSDISIMRNVFPMITINTSVINVCDVTVLSEDILNSEIKRMDNHDDRIRIWLKEKED